MGDLDKRFFVPISFRTPTKVRSIPKPFFIQQTADPDLPIAVFNKGLRELARIREDQRRWGRIGLWK